MFSDVHASAYACAPHLVSFVALAALNASADEQRRYHVDAYGNLQYGKPSYKVSSDGRVVEVDAYGNKQPHKTQ